MEEGERRLKQEDCSEDGLGPGILTLTSRRIAFDKTRSRIMDFTKRVGETVLDVPLPDVTKTWKEGLLIKKACFSARTEQGERTFKFGVFNAGGWVSAMQDALDNSGRGA